MERLQGDGLLAHRRFPGFMVAFYVPIIQDRIQLD
jgi:hypothetical protein